MNDEPSSVNFARAMPNWQPLVEYRRNGVAENTIHGAVSWVSGRNLLYSFGGNVEVYGRSMVKPLMMKVFAERVREGAQRRSRRRSPSHRTTATPSTSASRARSCCKANGV